MESLIDAEDFSGRLLHQAALWDNAELLEDLLNGEELGYINSADSWGRTPAHAAATTESSQCLLILVQAGANVNIACGPRGECRTPLHVAAEHGHVVNLQVLVDAGADLLAKDALGLTPLDLADKMDHRSCMEALREAVDKKEQDRQKDFYNLLDACAGGDINGVKTILGNQHSASDLVNYVPNGSSSLLFKASEHGQRDVVRYLIEQGARAIIHPVTKYSPLYIAAYNGKREIVEILLKKFPELINVQTVEKWLPLHAACFNGHAAVLEFLLKYKFPDENLISFKDRTGNWKYEMPFDINQQDLSGQSILYLACCIGNLRMVDLLLEYRVKAVSTTMPVPVQSESEPTSPEKGGLQRSRGIGLQALISKFQPKEEVLKSNEIWIKPVDLDVYCNQGVETALHVAVKNRHHAIASHLLAAGAVPNLTLQSARGGDGDHCLRSSTCLQEAARNRDMGMIDLLLKYGARDDQNLALSTSAQTDDYLVMSKLLALKAHQDQESRVNKNALAEMHMGRSMKGRSSVSSLTYNSMCPSIPVMVNWHQTGALTVVKEQWLIDCSVKLNQKLRLSPKYQPLALHAITRLDLSNNEIFSLPDVLWSLLSLKFLSLAGNKLESLNECTYCCPWLEEIQLQDNRLDSVPVSLFQLPALSILDLSNNKLTSVPFAMWTSPTLKEINLSLNMLSDLPTTVTPFLHRHESTSSLGTDSTNPQFDTSSVSDFGSDNVSVRSEDDLDGEVEEDARHLQEKTSQLEQIYLNHCNKWKSSVVIVDKEDFDPTLTGSENKLQTLNLSHNSFKEIPAGLSCLAPHLTRLHLSYNSLESLGPMARYPFYLKHLDLSHNQIASWHQEQDTDLSCYSLAQERSSSVCSTPEPRKLNRGNIKSSFKSTCVHKRHNKLDNLRTLILADNCLRDISLHLSVPDSVSSISEDQTFELLPATTTTTSASSTSTTSAVLATAPLPSAGGGCSDSSSAIQKSKLMFCNLSMLDVSNNSVRSVPVTIKELVNLSVLNLSGNEGIQDLPAEMGLLTRLWNLNTRGCRLQEPLASMTTSKHYKTMDIVGYLRSVLEDAKPYARMKLMVVGVQGIGKTTLLELLRGEGGSYKRTRQAEHWARRMGNRNINMKSGKGVSMSTVGVDIGDWTYEKRGKTANAFGPVVFRTWDFGGQQEYYTTHQYFLSKRSLYLVLWKIADGEKGINEIQQWLINIQARAPNSPVIIVGTHQDVVSTQFPPSFSEYLQNKIREKFINLVDPEKCGLPRVLDTLEVSCKTKFNIRHLANMIYDTAFSLRSQGSKQRLLEQKIPATYLYLEEIVGDLCVEMRHSSRDPVLGQIEYEELVTSHMKTKFNACFRDSAELHQATSFLHDNGVLLHYDDATLRDLYFLDPQWLCDMLSHVVTIREINPFVKNGIMLLSDLKHVFKSSTAVSLSAKSYIVNLLNKFEVGLTWDSRTLLIPCLLPTETMLFSGLPGVDSRVTIPLRSRGWSQRGRRAVQNSAGAGGTAGTIVGNSSFFTQNSQDSSSLSDGQAHPRSRSVPARRLLRTADISGPMDQLGGAQARKMPRDYDLSHRSEPEHAIHRLILLAYLPSGFWSRLLTRILADDSVVEILRSYFIIPQEVEQDPHLGKIINEHKPEWVCWQTGLQLQYLDTTLLSVREVLPRSLATLDYHHMNLMVKQEGTWTLVDQAGSAIIEISLPQDTVVIKRPVKDTGKKDPIGYQALVLDPCPRTVCQFLSMAVEHIDQLLEDWYPSLGTRFVHTSEGKMLVTRLVPCPRCLCAQMDKETNDPWKDFSFLSSKHAEELLSENISIKSSSTSVESRDSGVGRDGSRSGKEGTTDSIERKLDIAKHGLPPQEDKVYTFLVEECILYAFDGKNAECPLHVEQSLAQMAPDTVFLDLGERLVMSSEGIKRGSLIGRGAFGFVFGATCRGRGPGQPFREVAIKMLQPVNPGPKAKASSQAAYKAAMTKWERDPMQYACKAYTTARQELNILLNIKHSHVVPLVGICIKPLAIVLELAPLGALDSMLKHYRRSGDKLSTTTIQQICIQIARALEYLHQQHIIYRDLKSENVLVWDMPQPFQEVNNASNVQVKLADYGISRACLPTGTKGFGGTEGFMAPEIMKYNGEEEYTEKVDCFSFGMFMYELLTLHQPFEGQETVKELILEGGRPPLTQRELSYPSYFVDLMVICWSHQSRARPSASQIVSITSAPEFTHLLDTILLDQKSCFASSATTTMKIGSQHGHQELWLASKMSSLVSSETHLNILEAGLGGWSNHYTQREKLSDSVTSMTTVQDAIWVGTSQGTVHAYSSSTYRRIFSYQMDPDTETPSPIRSLYYIKSSGRVVVALHSGRIFMCQSDTIPVKETGGEGTFILTELGTSGCVHSVTSINKEENCVEVWCGQSQGAIAIFSLKESIVTNQDIVNHPLDVGEVMQVKSTETSEHVFSYLYPGCVIYQWHAEDKTIRAKLDCSKLIPCSESLKTINIDDQFSPGRCQVSTLEVVGDLLYIGTCWGCLVVVETINLRPVTVFRPFSDEIQSLVSFSPVSGKQCLVSIGRGYRNLIKRFCPDSGSGSGGQQDGGEEADSEKIYALLWSTDSWIML